MNARQEKDDRRLAPLVQYATGRGHYLRHASLAVLALALAGMVAWASSNWIAGDYFASLPSGSEQLGEQEVASNRTTKGDREASLKDNDKNDAGALAAWERLKDVPPAREIFDDPVVSENSTGIQVPLRRPDQRGPRRDIAGITAGSLEPASADPKTNASAALSPRMSEQAIKGEQTPEAEVASAALPTFRWPVRGKVVTGYGVKTNGKYNDGINLRVPLGTPVKAAEDGVVAYAGNELKRYGNLVLIRHSNGYITAYAHASELLVKLGDTIKRGQVIAKSGQSGEVESPQLHFEIRKGSTPVDPLQFLNGT